MRAGIEIRVTPEDRHRLEVIVRDRNAAQKHVARAKVILATADGCGTMEVVRRSGLSKPAVWRWQERFMHQAVDSLLRDKTRPPGKPRLPDEALRRVLDLTLSEPPGKATHWTGRMMAKVSGVSLRSVQRIWAAHGLEPHRIRICIALARPTACRAAQGRGWALCRSTRPCGGALGGREVPNPGARAHPARSAPEAGSARH